MQDKTYKLVCKKCGGTNIETKAWIDPNEDIILDNCPEEDINNNWCRDCEEHVRFKLIEL